VNPDGERDYRGHPKPGGDWPMALFLIALVVCTSVTCIFWIIKG